ncbi:MAG: septum formation initiator family protein [Acidimicrobiales bacterium]
MSTRHSSHTSHTTSSIPRVERARRASRPGADHTRFGTRVIDEEHQLVSRRPHRWLLAGLGLAVVMALGAALFVLPVQAWMRQRDDLDRKQQELAVLTEANRKLGAEVDHLQTPEGAKEAARDELGVVGPGEERVSMLPAAGPLPLPTGWPYDTIIQIVGVRQAAPTP